MDKRLDRGKKVSMFEISLGKRQKKISRQFGRPMGKKFRNFNLIMSKA